MDLKISRKICRTRCQTLYDIIYLDFFLENAQGSEFKGAPIRKYKQTRNKNVFFKEKKCKKNLVSLVKNVKSVFSTDFTEKIKRSNAPQQCRKAPKHDRA